MLFTAATELLLAFWSLWTYRKTVLGRLATITLICLGIFQVAEYRICEGVFAGNLAWTQIGLTAITLLPALGLHMIETIIGKNRYTWFGYLCAAIYIAFFVFTDTIVQGSYCTGNYVIIQTQPVAFGPYYFAFLFLAIIEAIHALRSKIVTIPSHRNALRWMVIGYLSFIVPMAVISAVSPPIRNSVPSILCGFAILLAVVLASRVLPMYHRSSHSKGR